MTLTRVTNKRVVNWVDLFWSVQVRSVETSTNLHSSGEVRVRVRYRGRCPRGEMSYISAHRLQRLIIVIIGCMATVFATTDR